MAGRGAPPKAPAERRNHHEPQRGDWTLLLPPTRKKPPALPPRGKGRGIWSARTRAGWKAWWSDPASTQWSESDQELVLHLADVFEEWIRTGTASFAAEVRQLRDHLGLTPKGRQDRRWKIITADVLPFEQPDGGATPPAPASKRRRLRAVDPAAT